MTEPRALITWFHRAPIESRTFHVMSSASNDRADLFAKAMAWPINSRLNPSPDGAVVVIGTHGEYLTSHVSKGAGQISTFCTAGAHLPQSDVPQHCHLPMSGITPQFG